MRFISEDAQRAFLHVITFNGLHQNSGAYCTVCDGVRFIMFGTGFLLKSIYLNEERRLGGSNVVGIRQGELTANQAATIIKNTDYVTVTDKSREESSNEVARSRFISSIQEDFPGLNIIEHIGGSDIFIHFGNYTPIVRAGNCLYKALVELYSTTLFDWNKNKIPLDVIYSFLAFCFHIVGFLHINPNTAWSLISNSLPNDIVSFFSTWN